MENKYWKCQDVLNFIKIHAENSFWFGKTISFETLTEGLKKLKTVDFDEVSPKALLNRYKGDKRKPFFETTSEIEFVSYQDAVTEILENCKCSAERVLNKEAVVKVLKQAPGLTIYDIQKIENSIDRQKVIRAIEKIKDSNFTKASVIKAIEGVSPTAEIQYDCCVDNRENQMVVCKNCDFFKPETYDSENGYVSGCCTRSFDFTVVKWDRYKNPIQARWKVPSYFHCKYGESKKFDTPERPE